MNTENRSELLGNYDVKKLLIKLTVPAAVAMIINALYNLVDTWFVGIGVSTAAIGALGFAFPIQMIILAFGIMIGVGSASVFSRAYGRNDHEQMQHVANSALRVGLFIALLSSISGFFIIRPILEFFGATDDNIGYAISYLRIIFLGLTPLTLSMVLTNLSRAEGRAKVAMYAMSIGAGLNIILDPIFIFILDLGVQGAAIATVISQTIAFIYIFTRAQSKESELHINIKEWFVFDIKTIWEILKIGFPNFLRNSLAALLMIYIFKIISIYGGDHVTMYQSIYSVINRIIMFLFLPAFALIQGLTPIAGFNFGAKKYKRLYDVIIYTSVLIIIYFALVFIFIQLMAPYIFSIFSNDNNAFFITEGAHIFRIISLGFAIVGFQIVLGSVFQSFGYPIRATIVALSRQFIIFIPLLVILTMVFRLEGVWYTFAISDILSGLFSLILMLIELKKIRSLSLKVVLT